MISWACSVHPSRCAFENRSVILFFCHVRNSYYPLKAPPSPPYLNVRPLADLSYPWPDHRNWVLGSTGRKGGGWDGRAEYLGEFVKRRRLDGRELRNIIFLLHRVAYPPLQPLCDHFSTIDELLCTLLARGRCGADLSSALAHKTAAT